MAGRAHYVPHASVRADFLELDPRAGERIFHHLAGPRNRADRRVHLARPLPLLFLLGSHADSDGAADRHVRARTQSVCRGQILSVYDDRVGVHAGGDPVALREDRDV